MRTSSTIAALLLPALLSLGTALHAADEVPMPPPIVVAQPSGPLPNDLPEEAQRLIEEAEQQPQVTISNRGQSQVEEYRIGGQVIMLRITPAHGHPYYLIDGDGDGNLETRRNPHDDPPVAQWPIIKW